MSLGPLLTLPAWRQLAGWDFVGRGPNDSDGNEDNCDKPGSKHALVPA
jgi:hypothetical protein